MHAIKTEQKLIVVGSGISGIMTAWQAIQSGYTVELFSKSPDPRSKSNINIENESSTFDSKNDQRYITIFEGHPYLELGGYVNKVYPGIADDFERDVLQGGILVSPFAQFSKSSQDWLNQRSCLNQKLLNKNQEEIEKVANLFDSYAKENRAAMEKWFEILTDLIRCSPKVLDTLSLHANGIIRLYDNSEVFDESLSSHKAEGVFIKEYTPLEIVEQYPSYKEGIERGFIAGGAIEIYGLAFAVGTVCCTMLDEIERSGAKIHFKTEVQKVLINEQNQVEGIRLFNEKRYIAHHYAFHTGAFAGPELFEYIPLAQNKLAAVEGYWITIENADVLVQGMRGKPNKVHGKKNLEEILNMVDQDSAKMYKTHFRDFGIDEKHLCNIAPIVDFNNMPIYRNGRTLLGVGSGYVFKGLAKRSKEGSVVFKKNLKSEQFVLVVMKLWLEALHGKTLLSKGKLIMHSIGCKRSFTPNDEEVDVNLFTTSGGVCMIHDGGNTGSTTKSPFIAGYIIEKMKMVSNLKLKTETMNSAFSDLRKTLARTVEQVSTHRWKELSLKLNQEIENAAKLRDFKKNQLRDYV